MKNLLRRLPAVEFLWMFLTHHVESVSDRRVDSNREVVIDDVVWNCVSNFHVVDIGRLFQIVVVIVVTVATAICLAPDDIIEVWRKRLLC